MPRTAIATDTNSGITKEEADSLGIFLLPMSFTVNDKDYKEGIDISQEDFYNMIERPNVKVSTTQPAPGEISRLWDEALENYDEVVYIPMSSGLSSSCQTAVTLSHTDEYNGRVFTVDNRRISVTQYQSVIDAKAMADNGMSARYIHEKLEKDAAESSIYIMVNDLTFLKRGGRITAAGALIASVMNLKPVLQIQGDKLDAYSKCRGTVAAKKSMINAMENDLSGRFAKYCKHKRMTLHIAYSDMTLSEVESWKNEVSEAFPGYNIHIAPLSLSIGCHIGPGSLALACSKITY